jgi:LysR family transcriptional activator of nhaA
MEESMSNTLNFHHLRYFQAIAREGSLTKAARRLNVAQSALSVQLRRLEEQLGHPLFERASKSLVLTEAGRVALDHADSIFKLGDDLTDTLKGRLARGRRLLRIGAAATLSRNFQIGLLREMAGRPDVELILRSGSPRELLVELRDLRLDLVLSNEPVMQDADSGLSSRLLAEQPVSLVSAPAAGRRRAFRIPEDLRSQPLLLPGRGCSFRTAFETLLERHGVQPVVAAEVDDMALLRLLARETGALALVPPVVVRDELGAGALVERHRFEDITEGFHAVVMRRRFANPLVAELLKSVSDQIVRPARRGR